MQLKKLKFRYEDVCFDFWIEESEQIISETIESTGVWEQNQLVLYADFIGDNGAFLDIGANVGVNSLYLKNIVPGARVISVEASDLNFQILKRNTQYVDIELRKAAVSDHDGVLNFIGTGTNAHIAGRSEGGGESVESLKLDSLCQELSLQTIDLLKIDVEGYTDLVLSGGANTLQRCKRAIIEFSIQDVTKRFCCNEDQVLAHFNDLFDILGGCFSHFYYISRGDGLVRITRANELIDLLNIEYGVGDIVASNGSVDHAINIQGYMMRKIRDLMRENHYRLTEVQVAFARLGKLEAG